MRARIEAAQKRRSRRRSRCICAWATLLAGLLTAGVLLREGSGPIVSISRAVHLQASNHLTWPGFVAISPGAMGHDSHAAPTQVVTAEP